MVKNSNLTAKFISRTPIERQKVSTCLKVFCHRTVAALRSHPSLKSENVGDTALFIDIMVKLWTVVNVRGLYESLSLSDERRSVIRSPSDLGLKILRDLGDMARSMRSTPGSQVKSLTKDNSSYLAHTCYGLHDLSSFFLSQNVDYAALGYFTTNPLKKEFSVLRQDSRGSYFISVQQVLSKNEIRKTNLCLNQNFQLLPATNLISTSV